MTAERVGKARATRRALMLVTGVLASIITFAVGANVALAHHAYLSASADCASNVTFRAFSWSGRASNSEGANPDVDVYYNYTGLASPVKVKDGSFAAHKPGSPGTPDEFSGTFVWPNGAPNTIQVYTKVNGTWGNGNTSKANQTVTVTKPTNCTATPKVTFQTKCVDNLGSVEISFTNSGNAPITLTVFVDNNAQAPTVTVPANTTTAIVKPYSSLSNNVNHTIQVKKSNGDVVGSTSYNPACAPATPAVTFAPVCANGLGQVTISFTNTGNAAVTLTVFIDNVAQTPTVAVPALTTTTPVTRVYGSLSNNVNHTIQVNNGAAIVGTSQYNPACAPGNPAVTFAPVCANSSGEISISFTNTGNAAVTLTVLIDAVAQTPTVSVPALTTTPIVQTYSALSNNVNHTIQVNNGATVVGASEYKPACAPAAPVVQFAPVCANNLGQMAISFTNSGNFPVTLTVLIDNVAQTPTVSVPALTATPIVQTYSALSNNVNHTVQVNNGDAVVGTTSYNPSCAPGTGSGGISHVCTNFDGTVTITLTRTGGDLPVVFVLDNQTYTLVTGDGPVVVTYDDVPNGPFVRSLTVNGEPSDLSVDVQCDAVLTGVPVCAEVDIKNVTTMYWYRLSNPGTLPVPVAWADGTGTVPAAGTLTVKSAASPLVATNGTITAVTVAGSTEVCGTKVTFEKKLVGQPITGEEYTIRVSRLVGPTYETYLTFPLNAGTVQEFVLPSTLDGIGITYKIEEIDDGTASLHTVSPDTFTLQGNLGETVSVVVTNGYAAVAIDKQVSATQVKGGDPLTYTLVAKNTGGLTLNPVVITDSMPPNLAMQSALVEGGQGTCVLVKETRPQLISCDIDGSLAPGASTPTITIVAQVDVATPVGATLLNQAKVLGKYIGAPDVAPSETYTDATRSAEIVRLRAEVDSEGAELSCLPVVDGTVCDLSAKVGSLILANSESESAVTVPPTVTPDPPVLTTPPISQLPVTGTSGISGMLGFGLVFLGIGGIAVIARRRRSSTSV